MKKCFCFMTVFMIALGICHASLAVTLTDIKGTRYENAVNSLIEVGLVNGFQDNTYRPNEAVTRAQMAKLMVIALGEEGQVSAASRKATSFTDINASHWAYGYVNVAKEIGIINGYTDGSFQPDATVSYAEATTMAIRALGFEPKVAQSKEIWPNNYMTVARNLKMLNSVGSFNNNNGAARGDVAIILWNMLNTGICKVTGSNNSGLIYGEGEKMITKYKNYVYMDDGEITSVKYDKEYENATVTVANESDKVSLILSDEDVQKYFGKRLTLMYNTKTKKLLSIEATKNYKEVTGDIDKVTTKKITVEDKAYTLPDKSDIVLYKTDELSEAVEATLFIEGSSVKYIFASGARNVELALVTAKNVTVSKKDGITIKKIGSTKTVNHALMDKDDMPDKYSVIAYYLNSKDELGILKEIKSENAYEIAALTTSKIKLNKTNYIYDEEKMKIYAATTSNIKSLAFKNINDDNDLAYPYEYGGTTYIIVFTDAAKAEQNKATAFKNLQSYIKTAEAKESKEASYSQATFVPYLTALKNARAIKSTDTAAKIETAHNELKSAYTGLKTVSTTSTEGKIAAKRAALRTLVNGTAATAVKNKATYVAASYTKFEKALTAANKILAKSNTALDDVTDAYDNLNDGIKQLASITDTEEYKTALNKLDSAIKAADELAPNEYDYTESTYKAYKTAYDAATTTKKNAASKTATELTTAANNLTKAMEGLEVAIDSAKDDLNELIVACIDLVENEDDYMPETFEKFEKAYEEARKAVTSDKVTDVKTALSNLETAKKNLKEIDSVLEEIVKAVADMKTATNVAEALNSDDKTSSAKLKKIENIEEAVKLDLEELIDDATEKVKYDKGDLTSCLADAKEALYASKPEISELVSCYTKLKVASDKITIPEEPEA